MIETDWSLDNLRDPRLRSLASYWGRLKGGRSAPARAELDPGELRALLPHIFMVDVLSPPGFRFRLAGTHFREITGQEITGKVIREVFPEDFCAEVEHHWGEAVERVRPKLGRGRLWLPDRDYVRWEGVVLPMSSDDARVDILLGGFVASVSPSGEATASDAPR